MKHKFDKDGPTLDLLKHLIKSTKNVDLSEIEIDIDHQRITIEDCERIKALELKAPMEIITVAKALKSSVDIAKDERGKISPTGGRTSMVVKAGGTEYKGVTLCNLKDNYDKHYGVTKCIGRIIGQL